MANRKLANKSSVPLDQKRVQTGDYLSEHYKLTISTFLSCVRQEAQFDLEDSKFFHKTLPIYVKEDDQIFHHFGFHEVIFPRPALCMWDI